MSQILVPYTDTANEAAAVNLALPRINYDVDFALKSSQAGSATITNLTTPFNTSEEVTFKLYQVADVYKNTAIPSGLTPLVKTGRKIVVHLSDTLRRVNTESELEALIPISAQLVVTIPDDGLVTQSVIETEIKRLIATLYSSKSTTPDRITSIFKGALVPKDVN